MDPWEFILEFNLVNYIISPGKGLACVLGKRKNLEKIHLDIFLSATSDEQFTKIKQMRVLAQNCSVLESVWSLIFIYTKWNPQFNSDVPNSGTRFRPRVFLQWRWDGSSLFSSKSWNPRACQMSRD
ncbi:hypothetical protein POTOM_002414 [Populus tomentosa]|uniref:Uncharacterized protein n=1 Tax=Populus tomentosa TaxID=118781 RepID=A0A8X8IZ57_POPTO|nr:hypothetical protein POTOM_002414 [Populus tomentosa]